MFDIQLFVWTFLLPSTGQYKDAVSPCSPRRTEEELSQIQATLRHKSAHNHSAHQQLCSCQCSQRESDEQWNKKKGPHEFSESVMVATAVKAKYVALGKQGGNLSCLLNSKSHLRRNYFVSAQTEMFRCVDSQEYKFLI
jgi:hypothetical protein